MKRIISLSLIALLAILVIAGAYLFFYPRMLFTTQANQSAEQAGISDAEQPAAPASTAQTTTVTKATSAQEIADGNPVTVQTLDNSTSLTTGWKTYTNTTYGFEFKYPDINVRLQTVGGWTDNNEPRVTSKTPFNYNECALAGEGPGMSASKMIIAGREYCLMTQFAREPGPNGATDPISSSYYEYVSRIGNEDVGIGFSASWGAGGQQVDKEARLLFAQILSTLKFTK